MSIYISGEYLRRHPAWHIEDSAWKAKQIARMIVSNGISPRTICEVGCGAGEILSQLQSRMDADCVFWGYEISPQAFELCKQRANERLQFKLMDVREEANVFYDLILVIDVLEHLEDYFSLLRAVRQKSRYQVFHIPLDISVQTVLRGGPIMNWRRSCGHLHYFTKDVALEVLKETGFEVVDHFYTPVSIELPTKSIKGRVARVPRKILFAVHRDLAVRILGGYSLMVLTKSPSLGLHSRVNGSSA